MFPKICLALLPLLASCSGKASADASDQAVAPDAPAIVFNSDSAYSYVARQVSFGPRVPNSDAHRLTGDWLVSELKRHGADVIEQRADLRAFDGNTLHARNILGRLNHSNPSRILLLAHYDSRPFSDKDPDPAKHDQPVDGANDGASGVGVLLEIARVLKEAGSTLGVDILFVDAEDYGTEGDDDSWAMGARYFATNPPVDNFSPQYAVLLDMVGGEGAKFPREYFSQREAPALNDRFYAAARRAGYGELFPNSLGGAVTDDHLEFLKVGIPAIDIIEYHPESGFNPHWHTSTDNLSNISPATLGAVGSSLLEMISPAE